MNVQKSSVTCRCGRVFEWPVFDVRLPQDMELQCGCGITHLIATRFESPRGTRYMYIRVYETGLVPEELLAARERIAAWARDRGNDTGRLGLVHA